VAEKALVNLSVLGHRRSAMTLSLPEGAAVIGITERLHAAVEEVGHVLDEPPPEVVITGFDGANTSITILYWHGPELWAERVASDRVGQTVLGLLAAEDFALSDPGIVVKGHDPPVLDRPASP
jgi:small-conductance mechanosensitive channel